MRKLYTMLFTLIVLLSIATSAEALESKITERHNGATAVASWTETNGKTTTDTYLSVTETDQGTDIYLDVYNWGSRFSSEKSGYLCTKDDVFSMDRKLNSASLSEVQIDVSDWNTGETETVAVKADWTGKGEVSQGSFRSSSRDGDYIYRSSDSSSSREALVTGSINGCNLGVNSYAWISQFKSAYISIEK